MFNPWSIRDTESAIIKVVDPETKKPTSTVITLAGPEHDKSKAFDFARNREQRKELSKTGRLQLPDPEMDAPRLVDELVNATLDWQGMAGPDGVELPFSPDNAKKAYTELPWLRDQIAEARRDRSNFIKRSAPA